MWLQVLQRWSSHPQPTLPADKTQLLHQAVKQLKEAGHLQHPRVQQVGSRSPPKLHRPRRKKQKKELYAAQMAESHKVLVDRYRQAGWEIIYTAGSSEDHPTVGRVGGYVVYFGDARDTAAHIPCEERQTNNRGELRAALHAVQHRNKSKQTLICSDSLLVVEGITGKAQKWRRHDWQGSAGPMGHVDLWTQLLHETESQGTAIQWLHVPLHIGMDGNTHADQLADIGRRHSPVLKGQVTVSLAGGQSLDDESESEPESDLEAPVMWTAMEGVGDHGTPLPLRQAASNDEREGRGEQPPLNTPPPPGASDHSAAQTQLSSRSICHAPAPWAKRWTGGN